MNTLPQELRRATTALRVSAEVEAWRQRLVSIPAHERSDHQRNLLAELDRILAAQGSTDGTPAFQPDEWSTRFNDALLAVSDAGADGVPAVIVGELETLRDQALAAVAGPVMRAVDG